MQVSHVGEQQRTWGGIMHRVLLSHIDVYGSVDLSSKARVLCLMARRVIQAQTNKRLLDDKDYFGNKRLELTGALIALLFEDLFKRFNSDLKRQIELKLNKYHQQLSSTRAIDRVEPPDVFRHPATETITRGIQHALSSGNWIIKRFRMDRSGVAQVLNRLSIVATVGMMTRVVSQFEKGRKVAGPRALQPSQWGMLCPCDTPEGEACGLVKNLSLMAHITLDTDTHTLLQLCYTLGVESCSTIGGEELHAPGTFIVMLNGRLLGAHRRPQQFITGIRTLRRMGKIGEFVSIYDNELHKTVYISCDGGRLCRPLIIVEGGVPRLTNKHMTMLQNGEFNFFDFLRCGIIEWVDVNEENGCLIAMRESDIIHASTHMEIDPLTILGVVAGLIPYPNHNQSPRNTYQCAMGKQAVGAIAYNQFERVDTLLYLLLYPQKPLCKTRTIELMNFDKLPAGQNASLAVMSYSGYDIEDATILSKASLDRGYGRCMYFRKQSVALCKHPNLTQDIVFPPPILTHNNNNNNNNINANKKGIHTHTHGTMKAYSSLDVDGVCRVGERLADDQIYINKYTPINTLEQVPPSTRLDPSLYRRTPSKYKGTETSYVDRVLCVSNDDDLCTYKVMLRQTRIPELGDKFSSRHGQKGVVGLIISQEDMPFAESGWCPDMIMNPHGFPSRMTVGKMIELIAGKSALLDGILKNGTIFGGTPVEDIGECLVSHGYSYSGKECLTSGVSGEAIEAYIFVGPVFYQRLKHMVQDKIHARGRGPRVALTHQPTEGRAKDGGLRLGEMERDCLVAYGASNLLLERLMISSDLFAASVCSVCGLLGYNGWCPYCQSSQGVCSVNIPYACKLLFQELLAMNVCARLHLNTN
eukprot:GHVR01170988.1.p1 GENE.GHVR01170988.1~~GHVR01170988.1.p1  ORF type:complete len:868 (+),score=218.67 GHVR01170988.1:1258-3861(+)